ncbi:fimbrial protein [Cedecea sp.]|uniref:fimbrial protein n=1 Tax=Cedecea sp. TaxID=1970739 RepID=UPI002F3F150E
MSVYPLNRLTLALALLTLSGLARAEVQGEIQGLDGVITPPEVILTQDKVTSNVPGAEFEVKWGYTPVYLGKSYCPSGPIERSTITYNARFADLLPGSDSWHKFNDYFDVKVVMSVGNGAGGSGTNIDNVVVPFPAKTGTDSDYVCYPTDKNGTPLGEHKMFYTASKGTATFRLRKSLDGNSDAKSEHTVEVFGFLTNGVGFGSDPIFRMTFRTDVEATPEKCTFNNGSPINVDFGDIGTDNLDGSRYVKNVDITFVCTGGRFDAGDVPISLALKQNGTSGDSFATNLADLSILVKRQGNLVKPNVAEPVTSPGNRGSWNLTAAPLAAVDASLGEGVFTASATVVASFQ